MDGEQTKLRVTTFESAESTVRVYPTFGRGHPAWQARKIDCAHGQRRMPVYVEIDPFLPDGMVALSLPIATHLRLANMPWPNPVQISEREIRFGPLIGILANPYWDREKRTLRHSSQLEGLKRMVEAAEDRGAACFLFRLADVDLKRGQIAGFTLHEGKWYRRTFPMPDVIYDQIVSRKTERDPAMRDRRLAISKRYGEKFFNDGFFDKWQVYEWLRKDPEVRRHVPETIRHKSLQEAASFVNRHQVTFLKPLHGSLGLGIARIVKHDGVVTYELKRKTSSVTRGKGNSAREVIESFRTRLKRRPYIWQEGLTLATYQHRPLDIRILMQRDGTGEWKRTKMFARVAKTGDFTSNLATGGDAMPVDRALAECFPKAEQRNRAKTQIRRLSKKIVEAIEEGSGRTYGELGIDLGLDESGKVWVIEVNSKPRKAPKTSNGRQDLVDLSFERPIGYAIYLATR